MKAVILDIPTTEIFTTKRFVELVEELTPYRLYDQKVKLENKFGIKFAQPNSYNRGLLFIAAVLEKLGIEVIYFNSDYDNNFWRHCSREIIDAELVLASVKTNNCNDVINYLNEAKIINPKIISIIGGPHPTALPVECLQHKAVDYVVLGEGEETLEELIIQITSNKIKLNHLLGVGYKKNHKIYINPLRSLIDDLDTLPLPAYHLLPGGLKSYHAYIDTSRGCTYECGFCSGPNMWRRCIRTRSYENFISELELIKSLIGSTNFIHISDPMLGVTPKQLNILKKLSRNKQIFFSCDVKANYVKDDVIQLMKDAGVVVFSLGVESLNDRTLQLVNKNCSAENELKAATIIKNSGQTFLKSYWIIGLPGEDKDSLLYNVNQMYELLKNKIVDQICSHILVPYPGTSFFSDPNRYNIKIENYNWSCYEGRSFAPVYSLKSLPSSEIYHYFLQSHESELKYYRETYPELSKSLVKVGDNNNISFAKFKGRLL